MKTQKGRKDRDIGPDFHVLLLAGFVLSTFPEELEQYIHMYDGAVMRRWGEGGDQCCIDCVLKTAGKRPTQVFEEP